jgi:hypothetical protein
MPPPNSVRPAAAAKGTPGRKPTVSKHASCCSQSVAGKPEQFTGTMSGYRETKKQSDDEYRSIHKNVFLFHLFRS